MCEYKKIGDKEDKRCKDIKKCVVDKTLEFNDYKKCLFDKDQRNSYRTEMLFQNKKHEIYTCKVNKIALNRDDDKRITRKDGLNTLAQGHYSIYD